MSRFIKHMGIRYIDVAVSFVLIALCVIDWNHLAAFCVSVCLLVFRYDPTLNNPTEKQG